MTAKRVTSESALQVDRLFHALGDSTRRAIVDRLAAGAVSVSALAAAQGITLTAVGQHLQILEAAELVTTHKLGRIRTCQIASAGFDRLQQWVHDHRTVWQHRMNRLGELLDSGPGEL